MADHAGVKIPPPLALALTVAATWVAHFFFPSPLEVFWGIGPILLAFGMIVILTCARVFRKSKTEIAPWKPSAILILGGPYRWMRNPIYFGMVLISYGAGLMFQTRWVFFIFPAFWIFLRFYVVAREEAYLKRRFGAAYEAYCRKTPRGL